MLERLALSLTPKTVLTSFSSMACILNPLLMTCSCTQVPPLQTSQVFAMQRLSQCSADVMNWCAARRLKLNANKTEELLVGSKNNLTKLVSQDLTLTIGTETIKPTAAVRDQGMWLNSELSSKQHVAKVANACFYQLRRLRQIRRRAGREVTTRLVLTFVIITIRLLQRTAIWTAILYT